MTTSGKNPLLACAKAGSFGRPQLCKDATPPTSNEIDSSDGRSSEATADPAVDEGGTSTTAAAEAAARVAGADFVVDAAGAAATAGEDHLLLEPAADSAALAPRDFGMMVSMAEPRKTTEAKQGLLVSSQMTMIPNHLNEMQ